MSNTYFKYLRCDVVRTLYGQLLAWDIVAGNCLSFVGQAVRLAEGSSGDDWMVAYLLRRARQSLVVNGLRRSQAEELREQFDTAISLFDWEHHASESASVA